MENKVYICENCKTYSFNTICENCKTYSFNTICSNCNSRSMVGTHPSNAQFVEPQKQKIKVFVAYSLQYISKKIFNIKIELEVIPGEDFSDEIIELVKNEHNCSKNEITITFFYKF